ncbi:MAG: PEP-CTERM sorting domain-containing protein [Roseateles sp.]|uniref:PEP-CTERM sorting domain-containing protein n=1 Tax=Roseateles sp. TaxID=1971397 RepID=UPI0039E759F2
MRTLSVLAFAASSLAMASAQAGSFNLSLNAADGSRWYEYFSDAYAELGSQHPGANPATGFSPDGFYLISTGAPVGTGAVVFPHANNFADLATLSYDDATGAITGLSFNAGGFSKFIADDDSVANVGYSTSVANVSGSVSLVGGQVSGITLNSNVTFTFDTMFGAAPYTGSFTINGSQFALDVDDSNMLPFGEFRYRWDVTGSVQNLAAPVPEPATYALMAAGLAAVGALARRRRHA